ncbi:MAG TPA: glycosyltransferase family 39 protein [Spirochaetia bacterium]|nr:glycosyltransferase family 39 protein [Spirochaetia bacterium]
MKKYLLLVLVLILATLLRFISLDKYPIGLNADEAALGYNAYSLLETGKDEHGTSWPLVFRSFDDYKPPLYVYLTIPFVKFLGLNVWSVRLPSAIAGVLTVFLVYLLVNALKIFPDKKKNEALALVSSLLLAVSPWHLHFSRGAWEVNISTFLLVLGVYGFILGLKNSKYFSLFSVSFALSLFTYHSARIIAPLLVIALVIIHRQSLFKKENLKGIIIASVLGIALSLPVVLQLISKEGQSRFSGVSIFADSGPLSYVLEQRRVDPNPDSLITKIKYNRYTAYAGYYFENYLSHYSKDFLFVSGDVIDRSRVPGFGQSYYPLILFVSLGILMLFIDRSPGGRTVFTWFLIAPAAAALTFQSPHALRSQNEVIPLSIISACGVIMLITFISKLKVKILPIIFSVVLLVGLIFQVKDYLYSYFVTYPRELPMAWQYGFSEIAEFTQAKYSKYDHIIITDRYDQPYILIAFFQKYPPQSLQKELVMGPIDNFGFSTGRQFGKYEFRKINPVSDLKLPNTLLVSEDTPFPESKVIKTIKSPTGIVLFKLIDTNLK